MSATLEPDTAPDTAPAPVEEPAALTCPDCGAAAAPGQLMCLECGARLALGYKRPASWKIAGAIIGVVLLVAGAALAFALAEITSDADEQSKAPAPTQPVASTPQAAPAETGTAPAQSTTTPSTTDAAPSETDATAPPALPDSDTPAPDTTASSDTWPESKSAHTVILASAGSRQEAEAKQKKAQDAGISAGILESKDFGSLRPGYWVVFDGQFDNVEDATARAEEDRGKGFADAYPRFVEPN